jgi:hypothetical protein
MQGVVGGTGGAADGSLLATALALVCICCALLAPRTTRADEFFEVRDENPLIRSFYLPLPTDSPLNAGAGFSATLIVANTLNVQSNAQESLHIDGESDTLNLTYENALAGSWRYRFTIPIIHDSGGVFDPIIDAWHDAFDLPQALRPSYPENKIVYAYSGHGTVNIDITHAQTSLGGVAADAGWYLIDDAQRTLSFWGGLQAPTGSVARLTSDGAWDGALWAHGALRFNQWQLAAEVGVAQPFGDEIFAGFAHKTSVFTRASVTRALGAVWSLRVQLDAQTARLSDTEMRFLGPSLLMSIGMERRLSGRWRLEFGFAEDAAVNTAPDVTFFLGIRG